MSAPLVCSKAPAFTTTAVLPDGSFGRVSLADYEGKWAVLVFYPLAFTFACTSAITLISDRKAEFDAINTDVLLLSVDSVFANHAWTQVPRNKGGIAGITYPIASDLTHSIGKDYGCLLEGGHHCRCTVIIDPKGIVRHVSMNDPPVERNVDEILRLVQGYQFHEENGEVCPANWKKGGKTIKQDVNKKNEYFESVFGQ